MKRTLITPSWNPRKYETPLIKDSESLVSVFSKFGREIPTYDDGFGSLWVYQQVFGPMYIVRADSFENALECVYDEMPTVPDDELHEAYGFDTREELDAAVKAEEYPNLTDGYSYQANASGTGVVFHGYDEALSKLTNEAIESLEISILIEGEDE